ncbi:MAG: NAD(P)-binding domain-containing protein [Myxococcota bacterium]
MSLDVLVLGFFLLVAGGAGWWMVRRRQVREAADTAVHAEAKAEGRLPPTLHPVVDPDKCMGSLSCLSVCPEGDILGVVDGKAALINPAACIGHGKCALECPVHAITLVFGDATRGVDLPETNEFFETSRPGVHIVGELGGMGLIKNAITQGLQVADHLGAQLGKHQAQAGAADVVVVGAGPAGLATALGLKKHGVSFRVLEQESVGGTIAHYPRQKVVMTEKVDLPFYGKFGKSLISKEELLESWQKAIQKSGVSIETGTKVEGIEGEDGRFVVQTNKGPVPAKKVVLAVGRRGTPRKLGVPGEDLPKVTYRLIDAQQYEGARVLVVGGGDAALEAAIQIAEETDAEVVLSYRQAELGKARDANKRRFKQLVDEGRIFAFMPSQVKEVKARSVTLHHGGKDLDLPNDFVIACLGGEVPTEFLKKNGIGMTRLHGERLGAKAGRGSALEEEAEKKHRRFSFMLFTLGALIVAALFVVGWDYYRLPLTHRTHHPAHTFLKPAGAWGHGVGIVATLFMMSNFLYAVRKRWTRLKGFRTIRGWLTFHQFVGFMSPLVIVFHAAFRSNNVLASLTAGALGIVVATGVVGRFIWGLVPGGDGQKAELGELTRRWERLKQRVHRAIDSLPAHDTINTVLEHVTHAPPERSLPVFFLHLPAQRVRDQRDLAHLKKLFPAQEEFLDFKRAYQRMRLLQTQVTFFRSLKRLLSAWRVLHVALALMLVVLIAAHIGVSLFLGYTWIFR